MTVIKKYNENTTEWEAIAVGQKGDTGEGLVTGGTTNQYLIKLSNTDFDTGWETLSSASVGLDNVDNTSDADKPVSTATQTALNDKADKTTEVIAGTGLDGGGDLSANRTLNLDSATVASLGLADTALQPADVGTAAAANTGDFATAAQGSLADTAVQPGDIGTLADQNANNVNITGGSVSGITDLAVADGGTGASDAAGARTNLELGSIATQNNNSVNIDGGTIDGTAVNATNLAYTGTLTGGTGIVNLGSGQVVKDANGNIGVGLTPSAWRTANDLQAIEIGPSIGLYSNDANNAYFANNWFLDADATTRYKNTGPAQIFAAEANNFIWFNAPSGTAGDPVTFQERMRIDSSGNVGVGTASPASLFHISGSNPQTRLQYTGTAGGFETLINFVDFRGVVNAAIGNHLLNDGVGTAAAHLVIKTATAGTLAERMRIDSSGNVGIGTTAPGARLDVLGTTRLRGDAAAGSSVHTTTFHNTRSGAFNIAQIQALAGPQHWAGELAFKTTSPSFANTLVERMRIDSSGNVLVGKTSNDNTTVGAKLQPSGTGVFVASSDVGILCNRLTTDGNLVEFRQDGTTEGTISVSGTTVSYNGGHLSRWSQLPNREKDESIVKGTVMTNLDDMAEWVHEDGTVEDNEQLNRMKVSDVEGDPNVSGVLVNWDDDDDMNIAMTGDMVIRIAQGVTVQRGDLLMSAGDGTAKPQGDDILRSKTIAKVTSTHVSHTYDDGSYLVPCVLMAC